MDIFVPIAIVIACVIFFGSIIYTIATLDK